MLAVSPSSAALVRRSCFTDLSFNAAFDLLAGPLLLRSPGGIGGILLVMIKNPCGRPLAWCAIVYRKPVPAWQCALCAFPDSGTLNFSAHKEYRVGPSELVAKATAAEAVEAAALFERRAKNATISIRFGLGQVSLLSACYTHSSRAIRFKSMS
jgi:hypothetical protein